MADVLKNSDELGNVLVQVQDDLRQLKRTLGRITFHEKGETVDIQALDTAIRRTESGIRRRAEEYQKTVNRQVLTLPSIEDLEKKNVQIPKWRPPLESIPDMHPQRGQSVGASPGEKHKAALAMRLLYNPIHPKNRTLMHQSYGIQLPDLRKRSGTTGPTQRVVTGPTVGRLAIVPGGAHNNLYLVPPLSEEDMTAGIASLLAKGLTPAAADVFRTTVQPKAAPLHPREDSCSSKLALTEKPLQGQKELTWGKDPGPSHSHGRERLSTSAIHTPPTSATSKSSEHRQMSQGAARLAPLHPQCLPALASTTVSKFSFTILEGRINPVAPDFCRFKQHYCLCWGLLVEVLWGLASLLRRYAVPMARVNGERLVELAQGGDLDWAVGGGGGGGGGGSSSVECLLSVLENREEVWDLVYRPGQRYRGEGGTEAAAARIQSCWRRHWARNAYLRHRQRKWAAGTIAISWLMHAQLGRVRKSLQESRRTHLDNYRIRGQYLSANWKHIQSSRRTIIHIPSLGYSQLQRFSLKGFDILQNIQMGRLCDVRDENVEVIYVSPVRLGDDLFQYYTRLLGLQPGGQGGLQRATVGPEDRGGLQGATVGPEDRGGGGARTTTTQASSCTKRFTILMPDALEDFPTHNMCLSTLLKYSPRTLRRIRNLIQGQQAFMVGGVTHLDDLAVADELGVPLLGPEPAVAQLYSTKSGGRRIFTGAGVTVPPGQWDIYSLQQLHETLAQLMTDHMEVRRWLFKMDSEMGGRGTAYCDVSHLSCSTWAQQEYSHHSPERWRKAWAQEPVLIKYLEEIPEWLSCYAQPVTTSCYPTWACFLDTFLRQGGVVEGYPPSDSVTCLTVDLLLQPDGEVTMLSCGDQLHGPSELETAGSSVPQTSVCPDVLHNLCLRVGQACLQRRITGHVSLDLATFLDPRTLEQQVWAVDLDLSYSNQLAMTQLMLMMTGGNLDCRTSRLEVPLTKPCPRKKGSKQPALPAVASHYAVLGSRLLHTNLSMVHYNVFFQMCKAQGIGFDIKEKQGTVFALHDSCERYSLGMVTIGEDLQGALLTFARNLSVIHQEISAPNMQGETNFKDLIRDIEKVLGMTVQNKAQVTKEEEKNAAVAARIKLDH
ncbi:IQ motif-containing protein H [Coregonus clupeaformis]|uniref:IQ motif-containing protein H n=1 Tax=Coregonus clupeaformis TaxID=59861 RepID=UPI001E1C8A4C|nr:IQ motif-containing protein H [Coregonus clupeaformis]